MNATATLVLMLTISSGLLASCGDQQGEDKARSQIFEPFPFGEYEFDKEPDISANETIDFGQVSPGNTVYRALEISNDGNDVLEVQKIEVPNQFSLERDAQLLIEPAESIRLNLAYTSDGPSRLETELKIISNDPDTPTWNTQLVAMTRNRCASSSQDPRAPVPVIEASSRSRETATASPNAHFNGAPLDTVELDARSSFDPDGHIESYQWTLLSRPEDSNAALTSQETSSSSIWLDLAGEYVVELDVRDDDDERPCSVATMRLTATPQEELHVQLVWNTMADPDQEDGSGSDLDLHLLRTGGFWGSRTHDCFWQNREPNWGNPVTSTDDPSLDIDDTDGLGPENINLQELSEEAYDIGVLYFAAHGYGPSNAKVRIYLSGQLDSSFEMTLHDGEFWSVARLYSEDRRVEEISDVQVRVDTGFSKNIIIGPFGSRQLFARR